MLGLSITFIIGGIIILLELTIEPLLRYIQRHRNIRLYERLEWVTNGSLQLQRMAHEELGAGTWSGTAETVPTTSRDEPLAILDISDQRHPHLVYKTPGPGDSEAAGKPPASSESGPPGSSSSSTHPPQPSPAETHDQNTPQESSGSPTPIFPDASPNGLLITDETCEFASASTVLAPTSTNPSSSPSPTPTPRSDQPTTTSPLIAESDSERPPKSNDPEDSAANHHYHTCRVSRSRSRTSSL